MDAGRIKAILDKEQQREMDYLDGEKMKIERRYEFLPEFLERSEKLSGLDAEQLIEIAGSIAWGRGMQWHEVLAIIDSYEARKARRMESKQTASA